MVGVRGFEPPASTSRTWLKASALGVTAHPVCIKCNLCGFFPTVLWIRAAFVPSHRDPEDPIFPKNSTRWQAVDRAWRVDVVFWS